MNACNATHCHTSRAPCPCPQACEVPEPCATTWHPGASSAPHSRHCTATELRAWAAHAAVVLLACAALVFIVKTASNA